MELSFSSLGCPDWTLERIAEKAKQYGYAGVELRAHEDGKHLSPADPPEKIRQAAAEFRKAGAEVFAISGYAQYSSSDPAKVKHHEELTRRLMEIALALGAKFIRVYGGAGAKGEELGVVGERVARALKPLAKEAFEKGLRLAVETHDAWNRGADLIQVLRNVDSPGLAVCFDIHNTIHTCGEWEDTYAVLKPHIAYCHIKDACPKVDGCNALVMVGAGELPLRGILRRLKADGFNGYLSFEWEKRWCPDLESPERVFPQYVYKMRGEWDEA